MIIFLFLCKLIINFFLFNRVFKNDDLYNLVNYVKNNGDIEVLPINNATIQIGKSNGSRNEDYFFKTISHFCSTNDIFQAKRNVKISELFYNDSILSKS